MVIRNYKILSNMDPGKLEAGVLELISHGWLLAGGVFVLTLPQHYSTGDISHYEHEYIQAVYLSE